MSRVINTANFLYNSADNIFIEGHTTCTYGQFFNKVISVASRLESLGIKKGNIVILYDMPDLETIFLLFALFHIEAVALPVNPRISYQELQKIKNFSGAKCVISNKITGADIVHSLGIFKNSMQVDKQTSFSPPQWNLKTPAIIILTSGSSGNPKMVVHSLNSVLQSARAVNIYFDLKSSDSWLLSLPLYHVSGLGILFRCLLSGANLVIPDIQSDINKSIIQFRPAYISLVITQLERLLNNRQSIDVLKNSQAVFLGGSAIPLSLIKQSLAHNLPIYTSYGLTEMASTVAIKKIVDPATSNAEILSCCQVKINEKKEILVKGDSMFLGYLNNDSIDKSQIENGWFSTGDFGISKGPFITVWGRRDNMFISGGENIYPEEIEKYLLSMEKIENAVVVAVDSQEFGQRPVAFIKTQMEIDEQKMKSYLKQYLPSYKIPDRFLSWPEKYAETGIKMKRKDFKSLL